MEKVSKEQVEEAVRTVKELKIKVADLNGRIKDAEAVVGLDHMADFSDGRLALEAGIIAIKAGAAKPVKEGKPLSTAARSELAAVLPPAYVKVACDFGVLYDSHDKVVRQILKARGVEIIRDDKFAVI